jgi:hypothetical protein
MKRKLQTRKTTKGKTGKTRKRKLTRKVTKAKRKTKKFSIKDARMVSKKRYNMLLQKKKRTKKENKDLDRALFVSYCKCIKKIKYAKDYKYGAEYPICMNSIYKQRGIKPPKDVTKKCKRYL